MSTVTDLGQASSATEKADIGNTDPPPKPSENALEFLKLIGDDDIKHILFEDNLVTISDTGKELGEFTVNVERTRHRGNDCLLVHANSHGALNGVPCGTSITTYVTHTLETLEQHHHEYVKLANHPLDRKTMITRTDDNYVINRVVTQGEDVHRSSRTILPENMSGFVSEGSNLLLQRLLAKKGLSEDFQLISLDSEAHPCSVVYKVLESRTQVVQETEFSVTGIERTINSISDLPTTWQSYFTKDGHLTSRVQVGSPVTMKLTVAPTLIEEDEELPKPTFEKQPLNWAEDLQMYSKFLDRKEELKNDHSIYMRHHPELQALMADFLQFLLLRKPDDVIAFAAEFFSSFSSKMPDSTSYAESESSTPFPLSRTNSKIQNLSQTQ